MYHKAYGIIETQAPLHVGASAGEETGNLNLIFRDQFTQTGMIPGSSIRGRFRADMRNPATNNGTRSHTESRYNDVALWYGHEAVTNPNQKDGGTTEALVKFEYASLVWFPVFSPGQPIVWVSCPSLLKRYQKQYRHIDPARMTTVRAVSLAARLVVILVAVILVLDNLPGVEITALVASLGIGGIAIALAVQSILSDLFASLSIILDKPFVLGDFIIVDTYMGTVEYIGLKTTRVRSLSGEQLVFANGDLLKSRIRNYKRMAERRVVFTLGVTYQTAYRHLKSIPGWIETIIGELDLTRFDRAHFQGFGDYALEFEIVYYVLDPDYNRYMDIQQAINLAIYKKFEAEKIDFAYPTQTVNLIDHQRIEGYSDTEEATVNRATHGAAQKG